MDRLVADAAEQFVLIGVAEDLQGGGVEEGDPSRGVDNVQGVGDGRDGPQERLRVLRQLGSRDHAFIVARWPADRPASPTPEGLLAAATQPTASHNVGRMPTRRRSWRWRWRRLIRGTRPNGHTARPKLLAATRDVLAPAGHAVGQPRPYSHD